jgi:uroporphyrinogen-III decarboxylase
MNLLPVDIFEVDFPSDLAQMKKGLGRHIISGNVSTITDLFDGTPDRVYASAARCHRICGDRHIVNAGCEIPPMSPPENVRALIRYAREHRPDEAALA